MVVVVRARLRRVYNPGADKSNPHTYLDGACSFTYLGVRAVGTFHSTATLSIQRVITACMGFGSCTVSIFPCPATATLAGQAIFFFRSFLVLTLTLYIYTEKIEFKLITSSTLFAVFPTPHERSAVPLHALLTHKVQSPQQYCEVHLRLLARVVSQSVLHKSSRVFACVLMAHSQRSV